MSLVEIALPIEGMNCVTCASHVEHALTQMEHVHRASVDPDAGHANVTYYKDQIDALDFVAAIEKAGYAIPVQESRFAVGGMTCTSCLAHVEGSLMDVSGVMGVNVNLANARAIVSYVPGLASLDELITAVAEAGYELSEAD